MWLTDGKCIFVVTHKFRCHERTLWRWKALYNGTRESLQPKSCRPHNTHKNAHTHKEIRAIKRLIKRNPEMSYFELLGELRTKIAYSRSYKGLYKFIVKHDMLGERKIRKRYISKQYFNPDIYGVKMQMDVKQVPTACLSGKAKDDYLQDGTELFQYTMIDECTRERFIYGYNEQSGYSTKDFIRRAVIHFGYVPFCIQTDNGSEFRNPPKSKELHIFDQQCQKNNILHKCIQAYTPRHNGKVERSHLKDQVNFYNNNTFESLDDLNEKLSGWLTRYNNMPTGVFKGCLSPLQKRAEIHERLKNLSKKELRNLRIADYERMQMGRLGNYSVL